MTPVTKRYTPEEAVSGLQVDVATKGRSEFFGRVAVVEILEENETNLKLNAENFPNEIVLKSKAVTTAKKNKRRLVTIKGVLAPNYVLSLYKHRLSGEDVTFKEFSKATNFTIFLPVTTLAPTLPRAVAENEDDDHDREEIVIVDNIDDGDNGKGDNDNNNSGAHDGFDGVFADNAGEEEDKEEEGEKKEEDGDDAIRPTVDESTSAAAAALADLMLGPFPDTNDFASFSAVVDDVFHFEDRVKMGMHHPSKKDYFVALRNAVMIEDENDMKKVVAALKKVGLSDEQIKQRKKFNNKWLA